MIAILPIAGTAGVFEEKTRRDAEQTIALRLETLKELIEIYEALPEALGEENGGLRH